MHEFVMLRFPGLILLYGLGLCSCVLDHRWQATKGRLTWVAGAAVIAAVALALLGGASLWEGAAWLLVFLLLVMGVKE